MRGVENFEENSSSKSYHHLRDEIETTNCKSLNYVNSYSNTKQLFSVLNAASADQVEVPKYTAEMEIYELKVNKTVLSGLLSLSDINS